MDGVVHSLDHNGIDIFFDPDVLCNSDIAREIARSPSTVLLVAFGAIRRGQAVPASQRQA